MLLLYLIVIIKYIIKDNLSYYFYEAIPVYIYFKNNLKIN